MSFLNNLGRQLQRPSSKQDLAVKDRRSRKWSTRSNKGKQENPVSSSSSASLYSPTGGNNGEFFPEPERFSYSNVEGKPSEDAPRQSSSYQSTSQQPPIQTSLNRPPSMLDMVFNRQSTNRRKPIEMTEDMARLDNLIRSEESRATLVQTLISMDSDFAVKVRFCSAVCKLELVADEEERKSMMEALTDLFFVPSSMFFLSSISKARAKAIINGNFDQLQVAKSEILAELTTNHEVMNIVNGS